MFADDLSSKCSSSKLSIIEKQLKTYLSYLEEWLKSGDCHL